MPAFGRSPLELVSGQLDWTRLDKKRQKEEAREKMGVQGAGCRQSFSASKKLRSAVIHLMPSTDFVICAAHKTCDTRFMLQ
jgi:hypothetical protein